VVTKPCEVCITTTDGNAIEQRDCGKLARIEVNGLPMCAACFAGFEAEELIESVGLFAEPQGAPPPAEVYGLQKRSDLRPIDPYAGAPPLLTAAERRFKR
jgi:hypothetical protein